jgi:flagellar hook-associated protein 1
MPGLFQGLEIGKRALLTHQVVLQTIGHNIANVNTPGYSRQRVQIGATLPENSTIGSLGTGINADNVRQVRDLFLGEQLRSDSKYQGQWSYKEKILSQIESLFAEPADGTLSAQLNKFWDSWSEVSTNPTSIGSRVAVIEQTNLMVNSFHEMANQLDRLRNAIDGDLVTLTSDVNRLSKEIANINLQIKSREIGMERANDLRDARDLLVDELSQIVDVNTVEEAGGGLLVFIGAMELVSGVDNQELQAKVENAGGYSKHTLVWKGTNTSIKNLNGQLHALVEMRDDVIPGYMRELDTLASNLITAVNNLHQTGTGLDSSTGRTFFDSAFQTAATMRLNSDLSDHPERLAASAGGEEGDNTIALAIHGLRTQRVMASGTTSINDYYNGIVGRLGVEAHQANSFASNYEMLVEQIKNTRDSVQGVSLDEEMANMVKFQHAYDAAARVITSFDQALDTVINTMGIVGR